MNIVNIEPVAARRRVLARILGLCAVASMFGGMRSVQSAGRLEVRDHLTIYSPSQLEQMKLGRGEVEMVAGFYSDVLAQSFPDLEALKAWVVRKIDADYRLQRLAVHKRFIVSHTEVALLVSKFRHAAT